uniref:Uncharacterized protein n=1 Tax=Cucumis sativus TaxID=3659 RepID=A0A0A0LXM2_CUCSA
MAKYLSDGFNVKAKREIEVNVEGPNPQWWVARLVGLQSEEATLMVWVSISDGLGLSKGAIFSTLVSISEVVLCT